MAERIGAAIVGAGPAGIASAIYLQRAGIAPVLFERREIGGLLRNANLVENYPGFPDGISGLNLAELFNEHLEKQMVRVIKTEVRAIKPTNEGFKIETGLRDYVSRVVMIGTGTRPMDIELEGSADLIGNRVFHEVVDLPLVDRDRKRIAVIGGGDAAFDYSINLKRRGHEVVLISRSATSCLPMLRKRAEEHGVDILEETTPLMIREEKDELILGIRGAKGRRKGEVNCDYLLVACGRKADLSVLCETLLKRIGTRRDSPKTKVPGLYLVGDVIRNRYRQTGIAIGDGILAAMYAEEYLNGVEVD